MLNTARDWLLVALLRAVIFISKILPWGWRIRVGGRVIGTITYLSPNARKRIEQSTQKIYPNWTNAQRRSFARANLRHFGQNMTELYNYKRFTQELPYFESVGEGWEVLRDQKANGQGAVCVSGHFGQWEAIRTQMAADDMQMAGLYKENSNPYYENMFREALEVSGPMFHTGVRGMAGLVRVLKSGGFISLLHDQRIKGAEVLPFMGQRAYTSTAAAEMALKYNVPLIPMYGLRLNDGRHYQIIAEAPIAPSDPVTMTQAMNDSLSAMVEAHPVQWLWLHNRWKLKKQDQ